MSDVLPAAGNAASTAPKRPLPADRWKDGRLYGLLESVHRLKEFLESSSLLFRGVALLLIAALSAIFVDAVFALPAASRIAADMLLAGSLGTLAFLLLLRLWRHRFQPQRVAVLLEERLDIRNNLFVNAVDFASSPPRSDSLLLRDRAVRMAEERAGSVSSLDVLPFSPLYRAAGVLAAAVLIVLSSWAVAPRLFGMVVPRLWDPTGDHPPYTLVEFDVQISPEPVFHGKPATISVALGGPERIEQASVVFVDADAPETLSMYHAGDQQFALQIERAERSRRFYIDTPRGRSQTMDFTVLEVPFFEEVRVAYKYPAYTGWDGQEHRLDGRPLRALVGTELTFSARSNLELRGGTLELTPAAAADSAAATPVTLSLATHPDDAHVVVGTLPVEVSGQFAISLIAKNGAPSIEPATGSLSAIPDRGPGVSIVAPGPYVVVVEDFTVPVTIEAVDDVGIAELRLYRSVNGWGPSATGLEFTRPRPNSARAETMFDLPTLGAQAGDIISYYVTAYDNHPSGAQFRDSETCVIQVISQEEYEQFARQQYQMDQLTQEFEAIREALDRLQQQRDELLEELEQLRQQLKEDPSNEETLQKIEKLEEQLQKFADEAQQLAEQLQQRTEQAQLYDIEEPYLEMLRKLSQDLEQQSQNAAGVQEALQRLQQESQSPESQSAFDEAAQQFSEQDDPFSQLAQEQRTAAAEDFELMQMADSLMSAADRMRGIIQQQRQLADKLAEFQNRDALTPEDQLRADRLAKDQELLEQELQQTVQQMREAADAAQDRLPKMCQSAQALCDAVEQAGITQDQQSAAQQARSGSGREAHQAAESAAQKLEALQSQCSSCEGAAGEMEGGMDGPLSLSKSGLQRTLEQLAQGRGIPGLGQKPGSGEGQNPGESGQSGVNGANGQNGTGQSQAPFWRPGQSFPGSQAPISVLGPHTMMEQQQQQTPSGRMQGDGRGEWLPFGNDPLPGAAESLTPDARDSSASGPGGLRGVPVPYRDAAEAYFRRLAEEN